MSDNDLSLLLDHLSCYQSVLGPLASITMLQVAWLLWRFDHCPPATHAHSGSWGRLPSKPSLEFKSGSPPPPLLTVTRTRTLGNIIRKSLKSTISRIRNMSTSRRCRRESSSSTSCRSSCSAGRAGEACESIGGLAGLGGCSRHLKSPSHTPG